MGKNGCFGTGKKAQGRGISCSYRHGAPGFLPLCLLWRPSIISRAARGPAKRTIVENRIMYRFLADLVLAVHFAYVAFVVAGMAAILLGIVLRWRWVRNFWFRAIHFAMIAVVVLESTFGILCPLTTWEDRLRAMSGETSAPGSFIARWMDKVLFVNLSPSVLALCYSLFGLAVFLTMILAPPRWPWESGKKAADNGDS